jgi:hypothetical protein
MIWPFSRAMMKNLDIITAAVSLIIKAAVLAAPATTGAAEDGCVRQVMQ